MSIKLLVVGAAGVGKTSFVKKLNGLPIMDEYEPTNGVELTQLDDYTFWDTAGQEDLAGLKDGYYIQTKLTFVLFDYTKYTSIKEAIKYIKTVKSLANTKIVVIRNKTDIQTTRTREIEEASKNLVARLKKNFTYHELSCKNDRFNFYSLFGRS